MQDPSICNICKIFVTTLQQGTVMKKLCNQEEEVYRKLMQDEFIRDFVPKYHRTVVVNDDDDQFIELEDLLRNLIFSLESCSFE